MSKPKNQPQLKVSLITTERNEEQSIAVFIESALQQSLKPDEIVIADAASTDDTVKIIQEYIDKGAPIKLVHAPGNRSVGRNAATKAAQNEIIACTDVGCRLDKDWLKHITAPLRLDPEAMIVSGSFVADPQTYFEKVSSTLMLSPNQHIDVATWEPSSRSIAYTKTAWKKAGGYPEYEEFGNSKLALMCGGEDTLYDRNLRKAGFEFQDGLRAKVYWRPRPNWSEFFKQYRMYSIGDGIRRVDSGHFKKLTLIYFSNLLLAMSSLIYPWLILIPVSYLSYKVGRRVYRPWRLMPDIKTLVLMAILAITFDLAQIIGYWTGWLARQQLPAEKRQG